MCQSEQQTPWARGKHGAVLTQDAGKGVAWSKQLKIKVYLLDPKKDSSVARLRMDPSLRGRLYHARSHKRYHPLCRPENSHQRAKHKPGLSRRSGTALSSVSRRLGVAIPSCVPSRIPPAVGQRPRSGEPLCATSARRCRQTQGDSQSPSLGHP